MKKVLLTMGFLFTSISQAFANPACVVCTVAVGASLSIARKLGVDDSVVGVWAGGMLALLGFWMVTWFDKKKWNFFGRDFLLVWGSVAMIGFVYISQITYSPRPMLYFLYIDPFLLSVVLGALVLIWSSDFYQWLKVKNGGKAHFPFEKVVVPVLSLAILSTYFYFYPICYIANELFAF